MNPQHTPPTEAAARARMALPAAAVPTASERLALSRAQLADWLDQDRAPRTGAPGTAWGALVNLPALKRWRSHPLVALALGAVARAWLRPAAGGTAPALQMLVLSTAVSVLRRYPKTVLTTVAIAAAMVVGARWRPRAKPPAAQPRNPATPKS